jgi:alanine dehydrogenase
MIVGVPKEIKSHENRIAVVPGGVEALVALGHEVLVEKDGGLGSGFEDSAYTAVGAEIVRDVDELWARADMIVKVKEPIAPEYERIREGQVLFTYFHFAADETLTRTILERKCVAIAYETVQLSTGELPLLTPMSEVAGRMAVQEGAKYLEKNQGGCGVGTNAAWIAAGFGAHVTILDLDLDRLRYLADVMPANVDTLFSNRRNILEQITRADLLVGAVLLPGAKAPSLVLRDDLKLMKDGSVIVDVAVDQGGCVETVRPTTHDNPIYVVEGVIHYCVANMPGAVPRTSTLALTNATSPYMLALANKGWVKACQDDAALAQGLNAVDGKLTYGAVGEAFGIESIDVSAVL